MWLFYGVGFLAQRFTNAIPALPLLSSTLTPAILDLPADHLLVLVVDTVAILRRGVTDM